jgi:hypothetical protein
LFSAARQTSPRGDLTGCRAGAREARTQAFSDAFYLIMMGFLLAALLVPLMKKPPAH